MSLAAIKISLGMVGGWMAVPMVIAGIILLRIGRWPRRAGTEPHCRKCEYLLLGITSDRCPECGTKLDAKNIVRGQRNRSPGVALSGCAFILLAIIAVTPTIRSRWSRIDWYPYKTVSMLVGEIDAKKNSTRAVKEIWRRDSANKLSAAGRNAVVDATLRNQDGQIGHIVRELLDFTGREYAAGRLTDAQKRKLFDNGISMRLLVRPTVAPGDPIPFRLYLTKMMPQSWQAKVSNLRVKIDQEGPFTDPESDLTLPFGGIGGPAETGWAIPSVPFFAPGEHQMEVTATYELMDETTKVVRREDRTLRGSFKMLDVEPHGYFTVIKDQSAMLKLAAPIKPIAVEFNTDTGELSGFLELSGASDVALEATAYWSGYSQVLKLGHYAERERRLVQPFTAWPPEGFPPPSKIEIIVSNSEQVARRTPDLYRMLQLYILHKEVTVQFRSNATSQPATRPW